MCSFSVENASSFHRSNSTKSEEAHADHIQRGNVSNRISMSIFLMPNFSRVCKKKAAPLQSSFNPDYSLGIFWVLETKEFSCSNHHLSGEDRVVRERENQKAGNSRLRINARSSPRWFVFALLFLQMLDPFFSKDLRFFGSTLISCSDSICEIEEPLRDLEHITVFEVWSNFCCSPFDVERMKWGKCTVFASNSAEHM